MKILAVNSISNANFKRSKNSNIQAGTNTHNIAFQGKVNQFGFIKNLVKLISKPKIKPEDLLKSYKKVEDLGNAVHTAYIIAKKKKTSIVDLNIFSPEMQKMLSSVKFDLYHIGAKGKGTYDVLLFDNKMLIHTI